MKEKRFIDRINELALRAFERGVYVYSDFLNPTEEAEVKAAVFPVPVTFYGGAVFCERKMAAFGDFGYEKNFPLSVLEITPKSEKFFKPVTHRDFLGALLGLGIERGKVGDIFTDGKTAYAVISDKLGQFVSDNLKKVGPNDVACTLCDAVPERFGPKKEERKINVSSPRIDAVICRVFNLPREAGAGLVSLGKVTVNGRECASPSYTPKEGDVISVRGAGKLIYRGECGVSSKGRLFVSVEVYV
ncbi:MAG: hypothetical protein J6Z34_05885 [Clostridia bacterium]|nr:hypothetical protein [Clostridia bacterium]